MPKLVIPIKGMHCASCEILVGDELKKIKNISEVLVNQSKGKAEIVYEGEKPDQKALENAVRAAGYEIGQNNKSTWLSRNPDDYIHFGIAFAIVLVLYVLGNITGFFDFTYVTDPKTSLGAVVMIGLVAGFSTCMALVGGLVLGLAARHAEKHPEATKIQKFRPHMFFNAGRIGGYVLFGGIIGAAGSIFSLSNNSLGIITIAVGLLMLILGLKLVEIFPKLKEKSFSLPSSIAKKIGLSSEIKEYTPKSSVMTGALTFFLPCGFTQAMQIYAMSTGSFTKGALIMGLFALGTAPGLLGVGGLTSLFKGSRARIFYMVAGIIVVALGSYNILNGQRLVSFADASTTPTVDNQQTQKIIKMTYSYNDGLQPTDLNLKVGEPVRLEIQAFDNGVGCMSSVMIPGLFNKFQYLQKGKTLVMTFTPKKAGVYNMTCAMGVPWGSINVQ